ncbi:9878_t:CDS:2 [Acaulospora colombiana]|uniref:9878_t:CDS:1 n=1 Tax=Acaulospora colombiana TaxID=27376 RepID=A0ACA9MRY7_9GLOM|nr:9878_t:CDS:2 [Acaulospora colombiana]
MKQFTSLLAAAVLATSVAGHGAVTSYVIAGTTYPGYTGFSPSSSPPTIQWQWPDYNPTLDPAMSSVMCNGGSSAALTATVAPGGQSTSTSVQVLSARAQEAVLDGLFKIDEAGLLSGTMYSGTWGAGKVLNTLQWTSTIPANLAPGNYLLRHELIAVHQAKTPQFYAECAQIVVSGSGTASPSGSYLVSIPGYCKLSDSNVSLDIYSEAAKTVTSWDVPGPPVWPNGSTSTYTPPVSSSTSTRPSSSSSSSSTRPSSSSSSSSSSGGAPLYGQCGGQGWTGPTTCASGTCKYSNASACLEQLLGQIFSSVLQLYPSAVEPQLLSKNLHGSSETPDLNRLR